MCAAPVTIVCDTREQDPLDFSPYEHFVSTQRTDRTGVDRNAKRQDAPVNHTMVANAQAIIFISRRRLCMQAAKETREIWRKVVDEIREIDDVLASCCVPECVYRGFCPEMKSCLYTLSADYGPECCRYHNTNI